jgi:hypothetical protein
LKNAATLQPERIAATIWLCYWIGAFLLGAALAKGSLLAPVYDVVGYLIAGAALEWLVWHEESYGDGPLNITTATSKMEVAKNVNTERSQTSIDRTGKMLMPSDITKAATKTPSTIAPPRITHPRSNNSLRRRHFNLQSSANG